MKYRPQLDGLRTIAVAAVVLHHYNLLIGGAGYGVHLFFVLSGFLITGILLGERANVDEGGISKFRAFRQFYARRVLRIFPLYYFVVLSGILLNVDYAREYSPWLLTYTINLKMAAQGWYIDNFSHFWSLAIEEQYYLIWPWLILLLPRRWLSRAAIIAIVTAPIFRFAVAMAASGALNNRAWIIGYIATPTAFDSLGMGSLVAILSSTDAGIAWLERWMRRVIPLVGVVLVIVSQFLLHGPAHLVLLDTSSAILFAWLVYAAATGFTGVAGKILAAAPIVYLGRISYGIYVYHPLVPGAITKIARRLGVALPASVGMNALIFAAFTILAATISWYVLEKPMNQLKRKFPYRTSEESEVAPAAAIS